MLRTAHFHSTSPEELVEFCNKYDVNLSIMQKHQSVEILDEGVAIVGDLNFDNRITDKMIDYPDLHELNFPNSYGVCDDPFQVLINPAFKESEREFFISFHPIYKAEQSEQGGWRWHKWGPYIGTKNPQNEYLYDEADIDMVYLFSIHEFDRSANVAV